MAEPIIMPKAGMAMEEGVITQWLKKEGDTVEKGEPILEIETDKVTMEVEADVSGTILKILYPNGTTVPVTVPIAWLGEPGEEIPDSSEPCEVAPPEPASEEVPKEENISSPTSAASPMAASGDRGPSTPAAKRIAAEQGIDLRNVNPSGKHGEVVAADVEAIGNVSATPLARKIAADQGIDLSQGRGSGHAGKIRKRDLSNVIARQDRREKLAGMRKVIASKMSSAHQQVPPAFLQIKADVTELVSLRSKLNEEGRAKITFNDFVVKAVADALETFPVFNAWLQGDEIIYKGAINIGIAVALENGLTVPVLRDVDQLTLTGVAVESKALVADAREGRLSPDSYTGGTFTITNLGMYGISAFAPIINLPEVAILGVCNIEDVLAMNGDAIVTRKMMGLSLTIDHRAVDGAQAAQFLNHVQDNLEQPFRLLESS